MVDFVSVILLPHERLVNLTSPFTMVIFICILSHEPFSSLSSEQRVYNYGERERKGTAKKKKLTKKNEK